VAFTDRRNTSSQLGATCAPSAKQNAAPSGVIQVHNFERLCFSQIADAYPDRYSKVNLAASKLVSDDGPRFVVERPDGDGHVVELVAALGHYWGQCTCDGFQYNDGPCSHLCGLKRAEGAELIEIPQGEPTAISVEVRDGQQELADHAAEPERRAATDGGVRR